MKIILLISLIQIYVGAFDPSQIDYCIIFCYPNKITSACADLCKLDKSRTEDMGDPGEFRQTILDIHNELRNKIARGDETKEYGYPSAADINVLNYDLELEHIVRCYIMSDRYQDAQHDPCRQVSYCNGTTAPGQNIVGLGDIRNRPLKQQFKMGMTAWYQELALIPESDRLSVINGFHHDPKWGHVGHFTALIWAKVDRIGCVRADIPKLKFTDPSKKPFQYSMICNYGVSNRPTTLSACGANTVTQPVYTPGEPCSKCEEGKKCNKDTPGGKYDALCGELKPVPKDKPEDIEKNAMYKGGSAVGRIVPYKFLISVSAFVLAVSLV